MLTRIKSSAPGPETHHPGPALVPASGVRRLPAGDGWSVRAYPSSPGVSEGWGIQGDRMGAGWVGYQKRRNYRSACAIKQLDEEL